MGGGGYTLRNIPRCWTYETSVALGVDIPNKIPDNIYSDYFYPEGTLHTPISNMDNLNNSEELHKITNILKENIKKLELYTPSLEVENKISKDEKQEALSERKKMNSEKKEEMSERERKEVN